MVLDSSAIIAILELEPEAEAFSNLIESDGVRLVSAVSVLETGILAEARKGEEGARALDAFLQQAELTVVAFDAEQASIARTAFRQFGKGRHAASLNFGDCAAYALARGSGESLLYKGNDFAKTDITAAF